MPPEGRYLTNKEGKCEYGEPDTPLTIGTSNFDLAQGLIFTGLGLILADKAYDEFTEATDNLEAVNRRRLDMARAIYDHNQSVTVPWINYGLDFAFAIDVRTPEYGSMCSYYAELADRYEQQGREAYQFYLARFNIEDNECNNSFGYYAGAMSVDSSYARTRSQERREERIRDEKTRMIVQSHAGTFRNPDPYFGLMEHSAQIYGYIQTQSFGQLNGALGMVGYGMQNIAGYFGANFVGS